MYKEQEDTHILQLLQLHIIIGNKEKETTTGNIYIIITRVYNGLFS